MERIDYADNVRKNFIKSLTLISMFTNGIPVQSVRELLESIDDLGTDIINSYNVDNATVYFLNSKYLLKTQMYTDYFRFLKLQDVIYGAEQLKKLPIIEDYDDILDYSDNNIVFIQMLDSMRNTHISSEYVKILLNKCLSNREVKYLSNLNPLFKLEYEMYNKDINLEFIKDKMFEHIEETPDKKQEVFEEASAFLFDLYNINKEEATNLFIELFNQDLGIISSTYEDENTIRLGQVVLRMDNLALMLKDYYEYEQKQYKLNRRNKDGLQ